jgi:cell pole-organizing protein PopZ
MLRPLLKDWLDQRLPEIVEDMVAREIARITGKSF